MILSSKIGVSICDVRFGNFDYYLFVIYSLGFTLFVDCLILGDLLNAFPFRDAIFLDDPIRSVVVVVVVGLNVHETDEWRQDKTTGYSHCRRNAHSYQLPRIMLKHIPCISDRSESGILGSLRHEYS